MSVLLWVQELCALMVKAECCAVQGGEIRINDTEKSGSTG